MKTLKFKFAIEKVFGLALGWDSYSNHREYSLLILCFTINVSWRTNLGHTSDEIDQLKKLRWSRNFAWLMLSMTTVLVILTELSPQIPTFMNLVWGMLLMLLVVLVISDTKSIKKLRKKVNRI